MSHHARVDEPATITVDVIADCLERAGRLRMAEYVRSLGESRSMQLRQARQHDEQCAALLQRLRQYEPADPVVEQRYYAAPPEASD